MLRSAARSARSFAKRSAPSSCTRRRRAVPYGIFTVNVTGCLLAGLLGGLGEHFEFLTADVRLFLFTGFLGGFTTFCAFGVETIALIERGAWKVGGIGA